jgi:hypothetical protein
VICYPADEQDLRFRIKPQRGGPWASPYTTLKEKVSDPFSFLGERLRYVRCPPNALEISPSAFCIETTHEKILT